MKGTYGILILFVIVLFVGACTAEQQTVTQDDAQVNENNVAQMPDINGQNEPEQKDEVANAEADTVSMDSIYNYGMLSEFEYQITASGQVSNMKYKISSDTVNGKAAWLSEAEATSSGANVNTKIWTDKITYACLKMSSTVSFNGQVMDTPVECPKEGPNSASTSTGGTTPQLTYEGTASVTVPAGTYNAKIYSLQGVKYYYADSVPIPVKVEYQGSVTELVSWR